MTTKAEIVSLLLNNDRALCRALVVLNNRQTPDEQVSESTRYLNGRGFSAAHAPRGTSMANFFKRTGFLTPRQKAWWRESVRGTPRIAMYAEQLLEEAQAKALRKALAAGNVASSS